MSDWHCYKCKVEVDEDDISLMYMDMLGFQPGFICPKCDLMLVPEETGWDIIRKNEEEIEAKMA